MAREPIASLMDKVPSQINIQDMKDEVDVEITDSLEELSSPEVEVTLEDDGGVVVDFDPERRRARG